MKFKKSTWFKTALRLQGSVIPAIFYRVLFCGLFGLLISVLYFFNFSVSWPILGSVVPSIVLGLLLVFRTNTAYDRFWEGRKCWGVLNNSIRNLSRQIWVSVIEEKPEDRAEKIAAMKLLVAFAIAMKLHLRNEPINVELEEMMPSTHYYKLKTMNNPPLEIAFWIADYLQKQYEEQRLSLYQLTTMQELLNNMVDMLGGCERIQKTPMPLAYAIHLKQLLLIYCLLLPFQLVKDLGFFTGAIISLIAFTLFGIEEIGIEIEDPFGRDPNDLPLDNICNNIKRNLEDLITLSPSIRNDRHKSQLV